MSTRREDDSRAAGSVTSQRHTARDVPAAKFREGSVGTVAPRGLRGPSLLPGQGAPERSASEDGEDPMEALREAETLDGPHLAREAAKRAPEPRSPTPMPVSVEVPRVRPSTPVRAESPSRPPTPSARSIQSGTLMSMGSIDPRAPTELSLPSPRSLSVAERAAYLRPGAITDRVPSLAPRSLPEVTESSPPSDLTQRSQAYQRRPRSSSGPASDMNANATHPASQPTSWRAPGSVPASERPAQSAASVRSARPWQAPDSLPPDAQRFARVPSSYSPLSSAADYPSAAPGSASPTPRSVRSSSPSSVDALPQVQVHAELGALAHEFYDEAFDLRSVSTLREPLASRKPMESADWTAHERASEFRLGDSESGARPSSRGSSTAGHDAR